MKNLSHFKTLIVVMVSFLGLIAFQNCSEVQFAGGENLVSSSPGPNGDGTVGIIDGSVPDEVSVINDIISNKINCEEGGHNFKESESLSGGDLQFESESGNGSFKDIGELELSAVNGVFQFLSVGSVSQMEFINGVFEIQAGSIDSINKLSGNYCISAGAIGSIEAISGVAFLEAGDGTMGQIGDLGMLSGKLYLKNMVVDKLHHFSGKLILDNSEIKDLDNSSVSGGVFSIDENGKLQRVN